MSENQTYTFDIVMSCGGCSGAVNRVLGKLEGVESYTVSLEDQKATVIAKPELSYETTLATIAKTGKKVTHGYINGEESEMAKVEA